MAEIENDLTQDVYQLSTAANLAGRMKGTEKFIQDSLEKALTKALQNKDWEVAWGPRVFKANPTDTKEGPEAVWYAAKSKSKPICVVAVAGTAVYSQTAWQEINFAVDKIVDFDKWVDSWKGGSINEPPVFQGTPNPRQAYCSLGTCRGVKIIVTNPSNAVQKGKRLYEYLNDTVIPSKQQIIFTGHSLGGAIAPTVAYSLLQSKFCKFERVQIYPSAGASPGNGVFSKNFASAFETARNLFNVWDVVPNAWGISAPPLQNMINIREKIYTREKALLDAKAFLDEWVPKFIRKSQDSGIVYKPLPSKDFKASREPRRVITRAGLGYDAKWQHVDAYWEYWNIKPWVQSFIKELLGANKDVTLDEGIEADEIEQIRQANEAEFQEVEDYE